jgi:hypothetical protein
LYAHDINFGKNQDGTWRDICKDCTYQNKLQKEEKKRLRMEGKNERAL